LDNIWPGLAEEKQQMKKKLRFDHYLPQKSQSRNYYHLSLNQMGGLEKCIMHFSGNPNQCANFGGVFLHLLTNTQKNVLAPITLP
jgi:hypothetical protein